MTIRLLLIFLGQSFLLSYTGVAGAAECTGCAKVEVRFKGLNCVMAGQSSTVSLGGKSVGATAKEGSGCPYTPTDWSDKFKLQVGDDHEYTLTSSGATCTTHVVVESKGCFPLLVKNDAGEWEESDGVFNEGGGTHSWTIKWAFPDEKGKADPAGDAGGLTPPDTIPDPESPLPGGGGPNVPGGSSTVEWNMSAGPTSNGRLAANVTFGIDLASANNGLTAEMFDVSRLAAGEAQPILVGGHLRQLMVPTASLTDIIVAPGGASAVVSVYSPTGATMSGGLWIPDGSPFVTYTFTFTDTGTIRTITLLETRPGQAPIEQPLSGITWTAATNAIGVIQGSAAGTERIETRTETVDQVARTRTVEITIKNSSNQVLTKERTISRKFVWGEEVIETIVDPDPGGKQYSTKYSYYNDVLPTEGAWGSLRTIVYPDGRWEFYDYNNAGMNTLSQRPWKDGPVPSINFSTASSEQVRGWAGSVQGQCRTSRNSYTGTPLQTEYLGSEEWIGHEKVGETKSSKTSGTVEMANVGLLKFKTITTTRISGRFADVLSDASTYDYDAPEPWGGRARRMLYANGTVDSYSYVKGNYNATTKDVAQDNNGTARKETVVHYKDASSGTLPGKTTRDIEIYDKEQLIVSQLWVYTPEATWAKLDETLYEYWPDGNLKTATKGNGRVIQEQTWTNGRLVSAIHESGIQTNYAYDGAGRLFRTTKIGTGGRPNLITETVYDGLDRTVEVKTQAQGNNEVIATSSQYNVAGEVVSTTDETGLTTSHATSSGGAVRTTTLPSGAARVEATYLDGQLKSFSGTSGPSGFFDYDVVDGLLTNTSYQGTSNQATQPSLRWSRTSVDWAGRVVKEERPGFGGGNVSATLFSYNNKGQRIASQSPGSSPMLFEYDAYGQLMRQGSDWNGNGVLDVAGNDPITESDLTYIKEGTIWYQVTSDYEYRQSGNGTRTLVRQSKTQMTGLTNTTISKELRTDAAGVIVTVTTTVDRPTATVTEKTTRSDCAASRVGNVVTVAGLLVSHTEPDSTHSSSFTYDHLERQLTGTSSLSGTRTFTYTPGTSQLATEYDALNQTTAYTYYGQGQLGAGQMMSKTCADLKVCRYAYDSVGRLVQQWGDADYPMEREYNGMGELQYLRTYRGGTGWTGVNWPDAPSRGAADVTEWSYDASTGWLQAKTDAAGKSVTYTYTPSGLLNTRTWARGVVTSYSYDPSKRLIATRYSDDTPTVLLGVDRAGRPTQVADGAGTASMTWTPDGKDDTVTYTHGPLAGVSVDRGFDAFQRKVSLAVTQNAVTLHTGGYEYDDRSRLSNITYGVYSATYSYHNTKGVPQTIAFKDNGTTVYSDITDHDAIGRISNRRVVTPTPVVTLNRINYTLFDAVNRRKEATREDGGIWKYNYNNRGEVTLGEKYRNTTSRYGSMRWEYAYDNLGNRTTAAQGSSGGLAGEVLLQHAYTASGLNQYSSVTNPGSVYITGATVDAATTVQVNGTNARRQGTFFWLPVAAGNGSGANRVNVTVAGTGTTQSGSYMGSLMIPPASTSPTYDFDGNLTSDGLWTYTWDGENRLKSMETVNALPEAARMRLEFAYDHMGRRVQKSRYRWHSGGTPGYKVESTLLFLYEGWNLIAELNFKHELVRGYLWGLDMSGSSQGAGGIAGLLFAHVASGPAAGNYTPAYDGNGNVLGYVNAATRTMASRYDYSPFGERVVQNETVEGLPSLGYSTKFTDTETGNVNFGYRLLRPSLGRWISRDPIEEEGGLNLYGTCGNDPVGKVDYLGREVFVLQVKNDEANPGALGSRTLGTLKEKARLHISVSTKPIGAPTRANGNIVPPALTPPVPKKGYSSLYVLLAGGCSRKENTTVMYDTVQISYDEKTGKFKVTRTGGTGAGGYSTPSDPLPKEKQAQVFGSTYTLLDVSKGGAKRGMAVFKAWTAYAGIDTFSYSWAGTPTPGPITEDPSGAVTTGPKPGMARTSPIVVKPKWVTPSGSTAPGPSDFGHYAIEFIVYGCEGGKAPDGTAPPAP